MLRNAPFFSSPKRIVTNYYCQPRLLKKWIPARKYQTANFGNASLTVQTAEIERIQV
jgi:hypothetical protein